MITPYLAQSELTGAVYIIYGKRKFNVTDSAKALFGKFKSGYERYEYIRTMTPRNFAELYAENLHTNKSFDELVDERMRERETKGANKQ